MSMIDNEQGWSRRAALFAALSLAGLVMAGWAMGSRTAEAAETVCVVCAAPDAQYSCSVAPSEAADLGLGGARLKVRCIRDIAEAYGHRTCKVATNPVATCAGTVHMLSRQPVAAGTGGAAPSGHAAPPPGPASGRAEGGGAPKTVVEMTRRAAGETQAQMEKSGEVVERAARQTWRCVTSLFTKCDADAGRAGEKPAPAPNQ